MPGLKHGRERRGIGAVSLDKELPGSMVVWVLTAFPSVCGIFLCFRRAILGKSSRWKSHFQHRCQHHLACLFFFGMEAHTQVSLLKKQLCQCLAVRICVWPTINKSQPGTKFENHFRVERKKMWLDSGKEVQPFGFLMSTNCRNLDSKFSVLCPTEKKEQAEQRKMSPGWCWSFLLRRETAWV